MRTEAFYSFMVEREQIRLRRAQGLPQSEWTADPIFKTYSFTNVKRRNDRTTTLLMDEVYSKFILRMDDEHGTDWSENIQQHHEEMRVLLLNCAIFRYFGCIETARVIGWSDDWSDERRAKMMSFGDVGMLKFTAAYIVPNCGRSETKYTVVCDIIDGIWRRSADVVSASASWERQCEILSSCYGCGSFMAKEILLDYILVSDSYPNDWQTWTPVGPGGRRGASRVKYGEKRDISEYEALGIIREVYAERDRYWPADMVSLDLTDVQFQMCERDKYLRVAEGRKPKRRFKPTIDAVTKGE